MNAHVIRAIFNRNFYAYFANPTGYVFIFVFVLLNSAAAFLPNDFFNSNLANLDQLNKYLPYILLVFIPAVTMSIWADERRQGTDELLLTIPAADFDVVLGKYLAAVAIYSVALLFSAFCNLVVLLWLGAPDLGLFAATYFGYWMVGLAMLAIGMVASFLTNNLTVGFVLGALFNLPLVLLARADWLLSSEWARPLQQWSLSALFSDFGRGVISLTSLVYFGMIIVIMLYLSMVLIGRRHWVAGRGGSGALALHYGVRTIALLAIAAGLVMLCSAAAFRYDISTEGLSRLSPKTKELLRDLESEHLVRLDAYISPQVPETYVQTRLNLINTLRELEQLGGSNLQVVIHDTEPLSEDADRAEKQFGITSRQVASRDRGAINFEEIYLGVAVTSGLNKVVVPFLDRGVPVEYELVRSIATVNQQERKKLGVLMTDAQLFGRIDPQTFQTVRNELIIDELEKQYDVVQVSADGPIEERYDVLLAVQPSTLSPEQMDNFLACVRSGQPTAIFEDPFPYLNPNVTATSAPKQAAGANPFMQQQPPEPKGDIGALWNLLGVDFTAHRIIWQEYNPYKEIQGFPEEFVFVDAGASQSLLFNDESQITRHLQQLLFLFCGSMRPLNSSTMEFKPLVHTGNNTGTVNYDEILQLNMFGQPEGLNADRRQFPTQEVYTLAARVVGKPGGENMPMAAEEPGEAPAAAQAAAADAEVDVVLIADIDLLYSDFFLLRAQGEDPERDLNLTLDNVTFVLNTLDVLADDPRFIDIRSRRPKHRTLTTIERVTDDSRKEAMDARDEFIKEFEDARQNEEEAFNKEIESLQERTDMDPLEKVQRIKIAQEVGQRRLQAKIDRLEKKRDKEVQRIERELTLEIQRVQDSYKLWAVLLPPIPPLLVGLVVLFNRRAREREGVAKSRLR